MTLMFLLILNQYTVVLSNCSVQKLLPVYESLAYRSAYKTSCDKSKCCRSRAYSGCPLDIKILQHRAKRSCSSMTTYHRNGTCTQANKRIKVQQLTHPECQEILKHYEHHNQSKEYEQRFSSALQHLKICLESN